MYLMRLDTVSALGEGRVKWMHKGDVSSNIKWRRCNEMHPHLVNRASMHTVTTTAAATSASTHTEQIVSVWPFPLKHDAFT